MITKEELLKKIKEAIWDEERTFPIHQKHIMQSLAWYGFTPDENRLIRDTLQKLAQETEGHARVLQEIYDAVSGGERDVY